MAEAVRVLMALRISFEEHSFGGGAIGGYGKPLPEPAFELARTRRGKLISVDKANVLETSRLWREVVTNLAREYPDVELRHGLVDSVAMWLVMNPGEFDVLVMENTFGDILSDVAAGVT